jgi:Mor family transcriptional regulator
MNEWVNELTIEDIQSEHMRAVAESCGIKDAISLMLNIPGIEIYVPKITTAVTEKEIATNACMRMVAERCGYGVAARLIMRRSELISPVIYIPKNGFSIIRKKFILKRFTGSNAMELALQCGVSDRYIQSIVADMYASRSQLSLFEPAVK